ncbi:MAG: hypothetical protein M3Y09_19805 [Actinomycetota bacterium]|nr:hypothetical protein [Actinomycetota bacterium]
MTDYFDRVETQLSALTASGVHDRGARRRRLLPSRRLTAVVPVLVSALVVLVVGAALLSTQGARDRFGGAHPPATPRRPVRIGRRDPGLIVPRRYGAACQQAADVCNPGASVPAALDRGMALTLPRGSRGCPATHGSRISTMLVGGIALGGARDTVRPVIDNGGRPRRGVIALGTTAVPGWRAIKIVWVAARRYAGPFVIRTEPLRRSGPARIGSAGGLPPRAPLLIPPGPTPNTGLDGYRTLPSALWVRRPGCYEVQVDGLNFTDDYVISAIAARP